MPAPFFGAPSVYRGTAEPPCGIRQQQQHYRTASLRQQQQQQQGALQARVHPAKTDSLLIDVPGSPLRQHMSHDFGQVRVQSKRLISAVPPMARDAGQIKPLGTAAKAEGPINFCVPLGGGGGFATTQHAPATPIAGSLAFKSVGGMGSVGFLAWLKKRCIPDMCVGATGTWIGPRHRRYLIRQARVSHIRLRHQSTV